jgi:hypothetical protein
MKRLSVLLATIAVLVACAPQERPEEGGEDQLTLFQQADGSVAVHSTFGTSRVRGWRVLDERRMVINVTGGPDVLGTFRMPCHGLRGAEVVGFRTLGPFDLDRSTVVILPDGQRCHFESLKPYREE